LQNIAWLRFFFPLGKKYHTLLLAAISRAAWNVRNEITFEKKIVWSPVMTIFFGVLVTPV
jgi:hypothetical protein